VDIRTKLVFSMVAVALGSMLVFGLITYSSIDEELRARRIEQLEGLADLKVSAVDRIVIGWEERVALVASRTQLRTSLASYNRSEPDLAVTRMQRILEDAATASPLFRRIAVFDAQGRFVTASGPDERTAENALRGQVLRVEVPTFLGVRFRARRAPDVLFAEPLVLDDQFIGTVRVSMSVEGIIELSGNYDGLGDTGETLVVALDSAGLARVLHPVRFPPEGTTGVGLVMSGDAGVMRALSGDEVRSTGRLADYRGENVWAATRRVEETGWGVVVKVDEAEHLGPTEEIRSNMIRLAVSLAAFAILIGTYVGLRFAQPIQKLAEAAQDLGAGNLSTRSGIDRQDEVGVLARTFDEMAEALEDQVAQLSEFRRFFDVSIDMMCIASTDGYFKLINFAFVRELGWSREALLAKPFTDFVHPEDLPATLREIERLASGSPTIRFENRFLCMDGSYKRLRWNAYPEANTGRLYSIARVATPESEPAL
jgi:PAS domain S-box-containing protein